MQIFKNTVEKLKILQTKDENINAINSKNLGNVDIIINIGDEKKKPGIYKIIIK